MESACQASRDGRTARREGEGIPEPTEMVALPLWESFPPEDRHRLVRVILQAARHQVEVHPTSSHRRR
jgi:hypothetical protein